MARTKNRPLPQHRLDAERPRSCSARCRARSRCPSLAMAGIIPAALGLLALHPLRRRVHADEAALALGGVGRRRARRDARADGLDRSDRPHRSRRASPCSACCSSGRSRTRTRSRIYRQREYDAAGLKTLPSTHGVASARRAIRAFLVVQVAVSFAAGAARRRGPALPRRPRRCSARWCSSRRFAGDGSDEVGTQRVPDLDRLPAGPVRGDGRRAVSA